MDQITNFEDPKARKHIEGIPGFIAYTVCLALVAAQLPTVVFDTTSKQFIAALGAIAMWRYSWGMIHFCRSMIYRKITFPAMRARAEALGDALMPPHVYLLVTSFRIKADCTA